MKSFVGLTKIFRSNLKYISDIIWTILQILTSIKMKNTKNEYYIMMFVILFAIIY